MAQCPILPETERSHKTCEPGAEKILAQPFLSRLNALHDAVRRGETLTPVRKATLYSESFQWEQANSVWPMVERTIREVENQIVRFIAFRPIVRFAYFPPLRFLDPHPRRQRAADPGKLLPPMQIPFS